MQVSHSGVHSLGASAHHSCCRRAIIHGLLGSRAVCLGVVHDVLGHLLEMRLVVVGRVEGRGLVCGWRRLEARCGARAIRRPVHDNEGLRAHGSRKQWTGRRQGQSTNRHGKDSGDPATGHGGDQTEIGEVRGYCRVRLGVSRQS